TPYSGRGIDLVVVRENVEDLYAGIEYMQTPGVAECLKLISQKGCEKIVRLGFELARAEGRKRVHCATKSNIMKLTEGLLKRTFEAIAPEYPEIEAQHIIIDNCAHQLVKKPEQFDVIVTTNMNGDIISDLSSALIGGLGFAPSANIGNEVSIFEAVHGSAPKYAGKNVINPTALVLSAVLMLRHLGEFDAATKMENSVLVTLEEGKVKTGDVVGYDRGATTTAFTDAVISNLGKKSARWHARDYKPIKLPQVSSRPDTVVPKSRRAAGVDIYVESALAAEELGRDLKQLAEGTPLKLKMISNRGAKVYPPMGTMTDCVDHWRCRFVARSEEGEITDEDVLSLVQRISAYHRWMHLEKLLEIDGKPGFTKAQGED
ncbi:MAG TPA: isocitrate/isopropylmalate family dehydrogenase, partial [Terriglobia bacterium]|nr:isocitrate/isopropylmalate family dehydrogenase [Terriglobia bacterium]